MPSAIVGAPLQRPAVPHPLQFNPFHSSHYRHKFPFPIQLCNHLYHHHSNNLLHLQQELRRTPYLPVQPTIPPSQPPQTSKSSTGTQMDIPPAIPTNILNEQLVAFLAFIINNLEENESKSNRIKLVVDAAAKCRGVSILYHFETRTSMT